MNTQPGKKTLVVRIWGNKSFESFQHILGQLERPCAYSGQEICSEQLWLIFKFTTSRR